MLYAWVGDERQRATPKARGRCDACPTPMIAKCGTIKIWHWAHETLDHCDPWRQGETAWHLGWKARFPKDWTERAIVRDGKKHVADVLLPTNKVIEFQHSSISAEEIVEREKFYRNILWVFDASKAAEASRFVTYQKDGYWTFCWRHPRHSLRRCALPVFVDLGDGYLFEIRKIYTASDNKCQRCNGSMRVKSEWGEWQICVCVDYTPKNRPRPWRGWGKMITLESFLKRHIPNYQEAGALSS